MLALNGLRVSEATGANIEALVVERGHRTLVITRKGGKVVTIPLAPRTARASDLAIGERCEGPIFLIPDGRRLDRHGAARIVRRGDIESFARDLETKGRASATVNRRLCTIAGFYKYAVEEELLDHSPAAHVRRARLDYESHAVGWTATRSARCWSPPGSASLASTR